MISIRTFAAAVVAFIMQYGTSAYAEDISTPVPKDSLTLTAETQEFSRSSGSLRSVRIDYKKVIDDTTVMVTAAGGRRSSPNEVVSAAGGGVELYHKWNDTVSTHSTIFVSSNKPVFAKLDISQDITATIATNTTGAIGVRWAEYANGDKLLFLNAGTRYYFKRGSISYRLTYTKPNGRPGYLAHLANLAINDQNGRGKTQFWASYGSTVLERSLLDGNFNGHDYGAVLRRVQPIGGIDLILVGGVASYANPAGRIWGKSVAFGLSLPL